jgi:hypothetical protein
MAFQNLNWSSIHASAYRQADAMLHLVEVGCAAIDSGRSA